MLQEQGLIPIFGGVIIPVKTMETVMGVAVYGMIKVLLLLVPLILILLV